MATGQTVVVGCKLPGGLIMEIVEPVNPSGPIGVMPAPIGKRVTLNGANSAKRQPTALGLPMLAEYPYGLTTVEKDFAEKWFARHKNFPFVENGSVFIVPDEKTAKGEAKDRVHDVKTGLEPKAPADADEKSKKTMQRQEQEIPASVSEAA